jgi:4-amino-4-deoxy-L-arabinose transferase-like glycosyltransferase
MESFDRFIRSSWVYAALAVLVFVASLPGLASMPVLDRDEGRFAEASSEMMETGDYVVIRYHEKLRNKKPVGIHWLQAVTVSLTSGAEARDIGAYRLPSLFGAMMAAMATFWAGTALFGRRAAFIGAVLLGCSLLLSTEAHIAKTDAAQCGVLALAMGCLAHMRARPGESHRRLSVIFWVCMAAGVLLKGVIAPMVGGFMIVGLLIWERKAAWMRPLLYWVGISLFCVMTIPWFIAVQVATQGDFLFEAAQVDLGQKLVSAAEGHNGPPGLHIAALPFLFWPGTLLLVPGLWFGFSSLWRKGADLLAQPRNGPAAVIAPEEGAAWRFLAVWLIPSWLVFEIAPTKLVHYTLPMYPAIALICGAAFDRWFDTERWNFGRWISVAIFIAVTLVLAILPTPWGLEMIRSDAAKDFGPQLAQRVDFIWADQWRQAGVGYWPTALILLAAAGTVYACVKKQPLLILGGLVACSLIGGIAYRAVILPNQKWMLASEASIDALKEICALPDGTAAWRKSGCAKELVNGRPLRAPQTIRAIAFAEPSFVFAMGDKVILEAKPVLPAVAEDNRPAWIINTGEKDGQAALGQLVEAAAAADRCVRFSRRYAYNYSNGDPSVLVAAVVEPADCPSTGQFPDLRPTQEDEPPEQLDDRRQTPN